MPEAFRAAPALLLIVVLLAPPAAAQKDEGRRAALRRAFVEAFGEHLEVASEELTRRSAWHGVGLYWLVHAMPKRAGYFRLKYRYRNVDHVNPKDPTHEFVERTMGFRVGERGCARRPRHAHVCVGDTLILPFVAGDSRNDFAEHVFTLDAYHPPSNDDAETYERPHDEKTFSSEPVNNPAGAFLKYVGRHSSYSPHRALGYTMEFYATFEAVAPGRFNLLLAASPPTEGAATAARLAGSVPVVVVERGAPITALVPRASVRGYSQSFESTWGEGYPVTPLILQPGERVTLPYHAFSVRGRDPGPGERAKDPAPFITLLPFHVDPAQGFNEWVVGRPPVKKQ